MTEQFNSNIKIFFRLFKSLSTGLKKNTYLSELQSKLIQGINIESNYVINIMGPYLFEARNEIEKGDFDKYIDMDYDVELSKICMKYKVNYTDAINTVEIMKTIYKTATNENKLKMLELVQSMLANYCQWKMSR